MGSELEYGHWGLALFYSVAWSVVIFALIRPRTLRELCVFVLLALFLLDEFTELYELPLSIKLVSRWLPIYPQTDLFSRRSGELWRILSRQSERAEGFDPYYIVGGVFIFGGLGVLYYAWRVLTAARASAFPAMTGPYVWARHPQYLSLISIMLGFVIAGPTLLTLAMFPFVTYLYVLLARHEEQEARSKFGPVYALYMKRTPRFAP